MASARTSPGRSGHLQARGVLAVAAGGALGAPARYGVGLLLPSTSATFPWGTFAVNVTGSLVLGALVVVLVERLGEARRLSQYLRLFLAVGVVGAYTTYSTYAVEVDTAVRDGHPWLAAAYAPASLGAGLLAAWAGVVAGRRLGRAGSGRGGVGTAV